VLAQQADPSSAKNAGKERAKAGFRLFWNNMNQQIMDYHFISIIINDEVRKISICKKNLELLKKIKTMVDSATD